MHHYYTYLKYWETYQQKFAYIDAKSQGILSMAAILTAVFTLLISEWKPLGIYYLDLLSFWGPFIGIFILISAQIFLLRCFATTVKKTPLSIEDKAIDLENRFHNGRKEDDPIKENYRGRTRTLESNMDTFLKLHLQMIQETGDEHRRLEISLQKKWEEVRLDPTDDYGSLEKAVSSFFGNLRDVVEDEVKKRHYYYELARLLVMVALYILPVCIYLYSLRDPLP